jgi:hypothetical protein
MIDPPLRFQFPSPQNIRIRGVFVMALCPKGLAVVFANQVYFQQPIRASSEFRPAL